MKTFYRYVSLAAVFWTTVSMSAYTPHETGSRTTASGAKAKEGYTCAANFVPIGSVIIYNNHKYYVQDRMHPSRNRHVDIFMESYRKALEFGRKEARVQVITPDDDHLKLPGTKGADKRTRRHKAKIADPDRRKTAKGSNRQLSGLHVPEAAPVLKPQAHP